MIIPDSLIEEILSGKKVIEFSEFADDDILYYANDEVIMCSPKTYIKITKELEKIKTSKKFNKDLKDTIDG